MPKLQITKIEHSELGTVETIEALGALQTKLTDEVPPSLICPQNLLQMKRASGLYTNSRSHSEISTTSLQQHTTKTIISPEQLYKYFQRKILIFSN